MPRKKKEETIEKIDNTNDINEVNKKIDILLKDHMEIEKAFKQLKEEQKLQSLHNDILESKLNTINSKFLFYEILIFIVSALFIIYALFYK